MDEFESLVKRENAIRYVPTAEEEASKMHSSLFYRFLGKHHTWKYLRVQEIGPGDDFLGPHIKAVVERDCIVCHQHEIRHANYRHLPYVGQILFQGTDEV